MVTSHSNKRFLSKYCRIVWRKYCILSCYVDCKRVRKFEHADAFLQESTAIFWETTPTNVCWYFQTVPLTTGPYVQKSMKILQKVWSHFMQCCLSEGESIRKDANTFLHGGFQQMPRAVLRDPILKATVLPTRKWFQHIALLSNKRVVALHVMFPVKEWMLLNVPFAFLWESRSGSWWGASLQVVSTNCIYCKFVLQCCCPSRASNDQISIPQLFLLSLATWSLTFPMSKQHALPGEHVKWECSHVGIPEQVIPAILRCVSAWKKCHRCCLVDTTKHLQERQKPGTTATFYHRETA